MERDLSLIRELLLRIEKMPDRGKGLDLDIEGYSKTTVIYNLDLAINVGLVDGTVRWLQGGSGPYIGNVKSLTWNGHDFLDSVRQEDVWKKTQEKAESAGHKIAHLCLEVVKELALSVIRSQFGLQG